MFFSQIACPLLIQVQLRVVFVIKKRSLTTLILLTILLLSCSDTKQDTNVTAFFYNESNGLQSLDPALAGYRSAIWIGSQIFNGLVELDTSLNITPAIAKSWRYDAAGTELTIDLRTDIRFHDNESFPNGKGRIVKAHDILFSFERICNAKTKSTGFWVFRDKVLGATEYNKATQENQQTKGVEGFTAINDSTFRIKLIKPFAPFLSILSTPYCWIIPQEAIIKYGDDFGRHPVGTGAFVFESWQEDVMLKLRKNPSYFKKDKSGEQLPYLSEVNVGFSRNAKSEFFEFTQGKLDFISSVDLSVNDKVFDAKGNLTDEYKRYSLIHASAQSIEYYGIQTDITLPAAAMPFCKDKRIRQAMNYAVDREKIVSFVLKNRALPATNGVLPPQYPGYSSSVHGYTYDVNKAKQLLSEAGYPDGKGLPEFTLQLGANETTASVAEAVIEQWKQIGIRAKLLQVDFPRHLSMVRAGELPIWRTSWIADYSDPENFLGLFYSGNKAPFGPNTTRIQRKDLDSLYEAALSPALDEKSRFALYNAMEKIVLDESPWIFLYYNVNIWLIQPNVKGLTAVNPLRLPLENVKKQ